MNASEKRAWHNLGFRHGSRDGEPQPPDGAAERRAYMTGFRAGRRERTGGFERALQDDAIATKR